MKEADTGLFRSLSVAGFFFILCVMLAFAAILGPPKKTWFALPKKGNAMRDLHMRDLELGDPERELQRDRDLEHEHEQDPGMPHPDEFRYDLFANPWKNRSQDSVAGPEPAHMPLLGSLSRGLNPEPGTQRGLDLPDPNMFNIPAESEDPFTDPIPEPAPVRPALISFRALTSLAPRVLRWKAQALDDDREDKSEDRGVEGAPAAADGVPDMAALSAAAAAARTPPDEPFPEWLITPKASAGPRAPRFFEVDVDSPSVTPPDHDFVAMQHELLKRVPVPVRPGMPRGSTWHPSQVAGEEFSRPVVARNQTTAD
ncbi:hypothetical protein INS49_009379 [Diaporthe citri]|uniref:uncharacterized protein n=1 Tax=Diaporthe citri TaxID=83186 RepID=UPI001C817182|nr:uncharacterized protein INS49_009379 [Diaporthe citri]KAG6361155.1 hypothetical protein INS49_009379 [Diaporthe citri]